MSDDFPSDSGWEKWILTEETWGHSCPDHDQVLLRHSWLQTEILTKELWGWERGSKSDLDLRGQENCRSFKGQHNWGQQDPELWEENGTLRGPLKNLWKTSGNLWKPLKTLPLGDPLRGRFPSQNLSGLLPLQLSPKEAHQVMAHPPAPGAYNDTKSFRCLSPQIRPLSAPWLFFLQRTLQHIQNPRFSRDLAWPPWDA